jgi:hypothetical protein
MEVKEEGYSPSPDTGKIIQDEGYSPSPGIQNSLRFPGFLQFSFCDPLSRTLLSPLPISICNVACGMNFTVRGHV